MICRYCGETVSAEKTCPCCGADLTDIHAAPEEYIPPPPNIPQPAVYAPPPPPQTAPSRSSGKLLKLFGVLGLLQLPAMLAEDFVNIAAQSDSEALAFFITCLLLSAINLLELAAYVLGFSGLLKRKQKLCACLPLLNGIYFAILLVIAFLAFLGSITYDPNSAAVMTVTLLLTLGYVICLFVIAVSMFSGKAPWTVLMLLPLLSYEFYGAVSSLIETLELYSIFGYYDDLGRTFVLCLATFARIIALLSFAFGYIIMTSNRKRRQGV